jgi:hypothetical protein
MSLVMAGFVVWGFSRTVDRNLLHPSTPKPVQLWFHGAIFSAWVVLFIAQSALVRLRKVSVHRVLGWFGAALAATMFISGIVVTPVMMRFDITVLHRVTVRSFLSILWCDMIIFGACMALAIYFRKRPQYHRRLVFMASCQLMQAAFVRLPFLGNHDLFYRLKNNHCWETVDIDFVDSAVLILAGIMRLRSRDASSGCVVADPDLSPIFAPAGRN